jgi:hypothetical protein
VKEKFVSPKFEEYMERIEEFITKNDETFYVEFSWATPSRVQIKDIYYVCIDEDDVDADGNGKKFLKRMNKACHYYYCATDIGITKKEYRLKGKTEIERYIFYDSKMNPLVKLPHKVLQTVKKIKDNITDVDVIDSVDSIDTIDEVEEKDL